MDSPDPKPEQEITMCSISAQQLGSATYILCVFKRKQLVDQVNQGKKSIKGRWGKVFFFVADWREKKVMNKDDTRHMVMVGQSVSECREGKTCFKRMQAVESE